MGGKLRRLRARIGRRGAFLGFLAMLDVVIGWFLLYPPAGSPPQPYPLLPAQAWAAWWLATAAACTAGMFLRTDRVAYAAAALLKTGWALRYAYLWYTGVPQSWVAMAIWLAFAGAVLIIAGWPEAVTVRDVPHPSSPRARRRRRPPGPPP